MCVGVQKAGTTSLHDILQQNNSVNLPTLKESHFFDDDDKYNKGIDYYFSHFFKNKPNAIYGEIVPEYSYFSKCAKRIENAFGKIKILFILRDPVVREYSHYLMTKRRGLEELDFKEAIQQEKNRLRSYDARVNYSYISRGFYSEQIERFEQYFGIENIKVILFEDLINDTRRTVKEISDFIELPDFEYNFDIKSNTASVSKSKYLRDFIYKPNNLKSIVGKLIPSKKAKDYIMHLLDQFNLKPAPKEKLSNDMRRMIYTTYYKKEIEYLERKIERPLTRWKHL